MALGVEYLALLLLLTTISANGTPVCPVLLGVANSYRWELDYTTPPVTKATLVCYGYHYVNKSKDRARKYQIECQADGQWSEDGLACVAFPCQALTGDPHGGWTFDSGTGPYEYGAKHTLVCDPDYTVDKYPGTAKTLQIECKDYGRWSDNNLACQRMPCPEFIRPPHSYWIFDSPKAHPWWLTRYYNYGVKYTFNCFGGYKVNKPEGVSHQIECLKEGKWSDDGFACVPE